MHMLVPDYILKNYANGLTSGGFSAAGLFVDISGFSSITDRLMEHGQHGAEVLAGVMRATFAPLILAVNQQGGFVVSQAGDAFTAVFPKQENLPSSELRALAAAWSIRQQAAQKSLYPSPYGDFAISVKVGAALGEVRWGIIPSSNRRRAVYYFQGSAIDGCSEAEHAAGMGEVILDAGLRAALGEHVSAAAVGSYFRLEALHAEMPPACKVTVPNLDLEVAGRFHPPELISQRRAGEFRQVAYLFISLPTVRTEEQLRLFMQTVFELQDQYGGMLELLFGDKGAHLLLFWGAPVAHENDVERAMNFILDLQARTAIPVNGGITYRVAHAGFIGSDLAEEYTAYGRGVNLAARFMTSAPRGEIWVDEDAARLAGRRFELEYVGERRFKGFSHLQKVYALLERKEAIEVFFEGKLVGRERELERLGSFVQPIFEGAYPGVMVVWGEPGMGKSRLAHEFLNSLRQDADNDFQIFLAQTDEILREPLNPFRYWLRGYFHVSESQGEGRNKRSFNRKLDLLIAATEDERLANELDRTRSFLGALVGLHWPDSLHQQLDARARYENTFIALASLLQVESLRQPAVFLLEDMHWLDADSIAFLPRLIRTLTAVEGKNYPIAILATARFEEIDRWLKDFPYQEIHLDRLDQADLTSMVNTRLGGLPADSLLRLLKERSSGNPFFAEQILSYILEKDLLQKVNDQWGVTSSQMVTVPSDVGAVLVARLDRMDAPVKEVVQTASVLGREFELRLLAQMLPDDPALLDKVAQVERESVWTPLGAARYYFRHILMRDAAYMMQTHAQRKTMHSLALQSMEAAYSGDLEEHYGELAYHAEQAGEQASALRYLNLAGRQAHDNYQNELAIDYYSRALALLPEDALRPRYELLLALEDVYDTVGKSAERRRDLDALEALLPNLDGVSALEVRLRKANFAIDTGQYSEGNALSRQAISMALELEDHARAVVGYLYLATSLFRQGKHTISAHQARQGLILARRMNLRIEEGKMLNTLGLLALEQGKMYDAIQDFKDTLKIAEESANLRLKVMPLNNLGMALVGQGDFEASRIYYEQCLEVARTIGERSGEGLVLGNLGFLAGARGEYQKASDYGASQLRIAREVGDRNGQMFSQINSSAYSRCLGEFEAALDLGERGLRMAQELGNQVGAAWALTNLGHAYLESGEPEKAGAAYREALAIREELDQPALATEPLAGLARLALLEEDVRHAGEHVGIILAHLDNGGTLEGTDDPLQVYVTCYHVLLKTGDGRAPDILEMAYQLLQRLAASIPEKETRERFMKGIPHHREVLEAWQRHPSPN